MVKSFILDTLEFDVPELTKFAKWYDVENIIKFQLFVTLPDEFQISVINKYLIDTYNITFCVNSNTYMISFYNALKAKKHIEQSYKQTKIVSDIIEVNEINTFRNSNLVNRYVIARTFALIKKNKY